MSQDRRRNRKPKASRVTRRMERTAWLGPSRLVVDYVTPSGEELLECGHALSSVGMTGRHGLVFRRCAECLQETKARD